jgi:hypothetical protein
MLADADPELNIFELDPQAINAKPCKKDSKCTGGNSLILSLATYDHIK